MSSQADKMRSELLGEKNVADVDVKHMPCACGEPDVGGVIHRQSGPCYMEDIVVEVPEPKPLNGNKIRVTRRAEYNANGSMSLYTLEIANPPTAQAEDILMNVLPEALELFLHKNQDYAHTANEDDALSLGPRGHFVDIWRKLKKVKSALWDGHELVGEQLPEIFEDFIGHSLLILREMKSQGRD